MYDEPLKRWTCSQCGHINTEEDKYCGYCGSPWEYVQIYCTRCKTVNNVRNESCKHCGKNLEPERTMDYLLESDEELLSLSTKYICFVIVNYALLFAGILSGICTALTFFVGKYMIYRETWIFVTILTIILFLLSLFLTTYLKIKTAKLLHKKTNHQLALKHKYRNRL